MLLSPEVMRHEKVINPENRILDRIGKSAQGAAPAKEGSGYDLQTVRGMKTPTSRSRNKGSPGSMRGATELLGLGALERSSRKKPLCFVRVSGRVWKRVPPTLSFMTLVIFDSEGFGSPLTAAGSASRVDASSSSSRPQRVDM